MKKQLLLALIAILTVIGLVFAEGGTPLPSNHSLTINSYVWTEAHPNLYYPCEANASYRLTTISQVPGSWIPLDSVADQNAWTFSVTASSQYDNWQSRVIPTDNGYSPYDLDYTIGSGFSTTEHRHLFEAEGASE